MINLKDGYVIVNTHSDAEFWAMLMRNRLMVLSAAASNPNNGPAVQEAIAAELDQVIEMLPDEAQMKKALAS